MPDLCVRHMHLLDKCKIYDLNGGIDDHKSGQNIHSILNMMWDYN